MPGDVLTLQRASDVLKLGATRCVYPPARGRLPPPRGDGSGVQGKGWFTKGTAGSQVFTDQCIAVKVIDFRGNEVVRVVGLLPQGRTPE